MAVAGFFPAKAALLGAAFLFLGSGCTTTDGFGGSRQAAVAWGQGRGFVETTVPASRFRLLALLRQRQPADTLTIYIEGDGAPWATPWHPPPDPTPLSPLALALAAGDSAPQVAYLGRPCQYLGEGELARCDGAYWMERRFAPEVAAAYDEIVTSLKTTAGARHIRLVGHSGGGILAVLLAARRQDVGEVITVAAPLALTEWTRWHDLSPLVGEDPALLVGQLPHGVHFAGDSDRTVPPAIVEHFVRAKGGRIEVVAGFDHECCWARDWSQLLERARTPENGK